MSGNLEMTGLRELIEALRHLPAELAEEAAVPVQEATEHTAAQLIAAYPTGPTGNLKRGVKQTIEKSAAGVVGTVRSTARDAHLWEFGTVNRRTKQGWNRGRSPSHAREGVIPIAQRNRKRMYEALREIVRRAGFEVS